MGERVIMSREILFKAKRKDWEELPKDQWWVEGDLLHMRYDDIVLINNFEDQLFRCDGNMVCQFTGLHDNTKWGDLTEAEKESFLSDWNYREDRKNKIEDWSGKKIWENDILRGHGNDDDLAKVVFGEFNVIDVETHEKVDRVIGWHTKVIETDVLSKCEPFCLPMPLTDFYIKQCEYEVVKNVFDNPELLEME